MTFNALPPDSVNSPAAFCATPSPDSGRGPLLIAPLTRIAVTPTPPASQALNVLGDPLQICSCEPMTGWFRDGSCRTNGADLGRHTVCCVVDERFLSYTRAQGNDLSTPAPAYGFPGLRPGDHWCVCAARWLEAYEDGVPPAVRLEACEQSALEVIPLEVLQAHAAKV
ncbi:DUF2237 domain-containing protein [Synechococcus sp. GreenBA-s]|nr:DUF2237 domain-containing protein [Synechococcus sp. GreenBA-s]